MDYGGSTFTGTVTATNNATREVTLSFTNPKNGKTETFIGVLREGYTVKLSNGILHEIKPSEMRLGARFKVYYQPETKKVGGKKTTINTIFLIGGASDVREHLSLFKAFP